MSVSNVPSDLWKPQRAPRQMKIAFQSSETGGLSESERAKILTHLADLLLLAAGVMSTKNDADER